MEVFLLSLGPTELPDLESILFLDKKAEEGRLLFLGESKCNLCHKNMGSEITIPGFGDGLIDTGVESFTSGTGARATPTRSTSAIQG